VRPDIEVVNTGLHGLRAVHHLATLEETLRLGPDMYLFMLGANDWMKQALDEHETLTDRIQAYSLRRTLLGLVLGKGQRWLLGLHGAEKLDDRGSAEPVDPYLLKRGSLYREDEREFAPSSVSPSYVEALEEVVAICRQRSLTCVLITQPNGYKPGISPEFKRSFWMTPPDARYTLTFESSIDLAALYNDFLRRFAAEQGLPLCDLDAVIEPSFENFYDEMHFNEQGARRVAASLSDCIRGLIPSGQDAGSQLGRPDEQQRDRALVPHGRDRAAVDQVAEEAMAVRGHGDQVAALALRRLQDLLGRVAQRQVHAHAQPARAQPVRLLLQVAAVRSHLLGLGERELLVVAGHEAVGDVDQEQLGAEQRRELADVRQETLVGAAVLDGDQDLAVHARYPPRPASQAVIPK
jgi:hypothetical protein